jgi:MFS family permease
MIQTVVALLAILVNASLQTRALKHLDGKPEHTTTERLLVAAVATQFIAAAVIIVVFIGMVVYRDNFRAHHTIAIHVALVMCGLLLLVGGSLGAAVAIRLQCHKDDPELRQAWSLASASAVIGILGAFVLVAAQAIAKRAVVKRVIREYLTSESVRVPTYLPIAKDKMPSYNPPTYKRAVSAV